MPTKKKRPTVSKPRPRANHTPSTPLVLAPSEIADRAYHLFLQRGGEHGHDWEDWLRAERELLSPIAERKFSHRR